MWPYLLSCTLAVVRTCTCYVCASTTTRGRLYIDQYVRTRSRPELQCYVRFNQVGPDYQALPCLRRCSWWVPAVRGRIVFFCPDALPCVRRCSWWVPAVRGKHFFCKIQWPVRWVPAVRWRNHYFPRNKEALPCCGRGPSCQPLHVQSMSDGSRSLTTLTTPHQSTKVVDDGEA